MLDPYLHSILQQRRAAREAVRLAWLAGHAVELEARRQAKNTPCGAKTRTGAPCKRRGSGRGGRCASHCGATHRRTPHTDSLTPDCACGALAMLSPSALSPTHVLIPEPNREIVKRARLEQKP